MCLRASRSLIGHWFTCRDASFTTICLYKLILNVIARLQTVCYAHTWFELLVNRHW